MSWPDEPTPKGWKKGGWSTADGIYNTLTHPSGYTIIPAKRGCLVIDKPKFKGERIKYRKDVKHFETLADAVKYVEGL